MISETLPVLVGPPLSPQASFDAAVAEAYGVEHLAPAPRGEGRHSDNA